MDVFMWFIEECPFIWCPVVLLLLGFVLVSGCFIILIYPVLGYFLERDGGVKVADDF